MSKSQSGFLLGIGSNIEPENNIARVIDELMGQFNSFSLSKIVKIPPIGMDSQREFLNLVVFIETELAQPALKAICNQIEVKLGRDRNDPDRSKKDRPADLDILCHINFPDDQTKPIEAITDEFFLYPLIEEMIAYLSNEPMTSQLQGQAITVNGLTFGQSATTINSNTDSGHKRVI